jgi:protein-S-isoprenylcysteine O-methyltransferase Ste14
MEPHVIIMIYYLSVGFYGAFELMFQLRMSAWKPSGPDRSFILVMIPFFMAVYLPPGEYLLLKPELYLSLQITGLSVLLAGSVLRFVSLSVLKKSFFVSISAAPDSSLVISGPYKYIRHPLYLATIFISVSGSIVFSSLFTWIFVILTISGIVIRIRKEEAFLITRYKDYAVYQRRTRKLIPFIY